MSDPVIYLVVRATSDRERIEGSGEVPCSVCNENCLFSPRPLAEAREFADRMKTALKVVCDECLNAGALKAAAK